MGPWRAMSNLLLNLSKKVLKFFYKMRQSPEGMGKGGKLWNGTWAFQKKICQQLADQKLPSPGPIAANSGMGKPRECAQKGGSLGPKPV